MNYVDLETLRKHIVGMCSMSLENILWLASLKEMIDICISFTDYMNIIRYDKHRGLLSGGRDDKNRPTISIGGITITGLLKDELDKYRILK